MRDYRIGREQINRYAAHLRREERSPGTVENYLRHARAFAAWLDGRPVTRERGRGMEGASACQRLRPGDRQRHAGGPQRLVPLSGLGGLPGEDF